MKTIGRYEIINEIGRGGFGVVYQARDPLMDRIVAIKLMLRDSGDDDAAAAAQLSRFKREAQITGNLNHPNLVTIFEFGSFQEQPFLVMEYLRGADLGHIIKEARPLSLLDRLDTLTQASNGLARAHQEDVVHRDIKPQNIFLLDDQRVKVMDFGIARMTGGVNTALTRTGYQIGSLPWMAPEQFDGVADFQTDVWSFGVTAYEFLTGVHPFLSSKLKQGTEELFSRIVFARYIVPNEVAPQLPSAVSEVIVRMMKKERTERYGSMDEVRLDLEALLGTQRQSQSMTLVRQADALRLEGNADRALLVVREALQLDKANTEAHQLRRFLQSEVRSRESLRQVGQAISSANLLAARQDTSGAIELLEKALLLDRENEAIRARLAELQGNQNRISQLDRLVTEAERAFESQDLSEARSMLQSALALDPAYVPARELLGRVEAADKRLSVLNSLHTTLASARATLTRGGITQAYQQLEVFDRQAAPLDIPMSLREQRGELKEMLLAAEAAAQTLSEARSALNRQDFRTALALLEAVGPVPQRPIVDMLLGQVRAQFADWTSKFSSEAILPRVKQLRSDGRFAEALAELRRAIEVNPSDDRLRQMSAWIQRESETQEALASVARLEQDVRAHFASNVEGSFDQVDRAIALYAALPAPLERLKSLQDGLIATLVSSARQALDEADFPTQRKLSMVLEATSRRFPAAIELQTVAGELYRNLEKSNAEEAIRAAETSLEARQLPQSEIACAAIDRMHGVSASAQARLGLMAWRSSKAVADSIVRNDPHERDRLNEALRFAQIATKLEGAPSVELARWVQTLETAQRIQTLRSTLLEIAPLPSPTAARRKQFEASLATYSVESNRDPGELPYFIEVVRLWTTPFRRAGKVDQVRGIVENAIVLWPEARSAFASDLAEPLAVPSLSVALTPAVPRPWRAVTSAVVVIGVGIAFAGWLFTRPSSTQSGAVVERTPVVESTPVVDTKPVETKPTGPVGQLSADVVAAKPKPPTARPVVPSPEVKPVPVSGPEPGVAIPPPPVTNPPVTPPKPDSQATPVPTSGSVGFEGIRSSDITWTGTLATGADLSVTDNRPSIGAISEGRIHPKPGTVQVQEPSTGVAVVAAPSAGTGWRSITLRNNSGSEVRRIRLRWRAQSSF